jgi:putative ABC transport system permease protein
VFGLVVGIPSSWVTATLIRSMLFGVEPSAPHVFAFACSALVIAGALATVVPAVTASRVDPVVALRTEV